MNYRKAGLQHLIPQMYSSEEIRYKALIELFSETCFRDFFCPYCEPHLLRLDAALINQIRAAEDDDDHK